MQKAEDNIPRLCSVLDLHRIALFQSATLCSCLIIACTHANDGVIAALLIVENRKHVSHIHRAKLFKFSERHIHHSSLVRKVVHLPTFHRPNHFQLAHGELLVLLQDFHVTYHFGDHPFLFCFHCLHTCLSSKQFFNRLDKCHSDYLLSSYSLLYHIIQFLANYSKVF